MEFINEKRLFKLIDKFFSSPEGVLREMSQNAFRAGATKCSIFYKDGMLTVVDNGKGIADWQRLVVLADTGWDEETITHQTPAGWGMFYLYSVSDMVKITSRFGTLVIDTERFFRDSEYRERLQPESTPVVDGTVIVAAIKPEFFKALNNIDNSELRVVSDLGYYDTVGMEVTFNGERVKADKFYYEYPVIFQYEGNTVYAKPGNDSPMEIGAVWYGEPINLFSGSYWRSRPHVVIEVTEGSPVTPVLPYRHDLQKDKKLTALHNETVRQITEYCISEINNGAESSYLYEFLSLFAADEDIEKCNRWRFSEEKIGLDSWIYNNKETVFIEKGENIPQTVIIEDVLVDGEPYDEDIGCGNNDDIVDEASLIVPFPAVSKCKPATSRYPSWAKPIEVMYKVYISTEEPAVEMSDYGVYYHSGCGIKFVATDGSMVMEEIPWIALRTCLENRTDVYCMNREAVYEASGEVFDMAIYYEDGDTYDSQKWYFDEDFRKTVIPRLEGKINLRDALGYIAETTGLYLDDIKSIKIESDGDEKTIRISTTKAKEEVVLNCF